ncbi:MAG TPA: LuxR C-terminal-related transcriptional regulator [Usitatibacter sp.]|nr:LuxR C-terminal-related transcriptional regulator [Usitatibacter sp.]
MKKTVVLGDKLQQMLELLAQGASTKGLAKKMGYSEGTVRVYLHNMYRALGVKNRTEAVLWHMRAEREQGQVVAAMSTQDETGNKPAMAASFGEAAERDGLLHALGVMESFLGPYGRQWEVALRLKGGELDTAATQRQGRSRALWRALLGADFAYAKRICDRGEEGGLLAQSPEAVLLVLLLQAGGYTHAGDQAMARLGRRGETAVAGRELDLLKALRAALYDRDDVALNTVHRLATAASTPPVVKHLAMVSLYYAQVARRDFEQARGTADALWGEAERSRAQLAAMGVRPFAEASSATPSTSEGRRETAVQRAKTTAR